MFKTIFCFACFLPGLAFSVVWKNLDIEVELTPERKALVSERHDFTPDTDKFISLPFYLGEKQKVLIKKVEFLDVIKNKKILARDEVEIENEAKSQEHGAPPLPAADYRYRYTANNVLMIFFPKAQVRDLHLSLDYEVEEILRVKKQEYNLRFSWGHPKRNGTISNFSFNMKAPLDWSCMEGLPERISRRELSEKDQFLTELHFKSKAEINKGPKEVTVYDEIFTCQLETDLLGSLLKTYLPDLPASGFKISENANYSFRVKGNSDGIFDVLDARTSIDADYKLGEEEAKTINERSATLYQVRFGNEKQRIMLKLNDYIHTIIYSSLNIYYLSSVELGKKVLFESKLNKGKNFEVTKNEDGLYIFSGQLKLSVRAPVVTDVEGMKFVTESAQILLNDADLSGISFTLGLKSCKKI